MSQEEYYFTDNDLTTLLSLGGLTDVKGIAPLYPNAIAVLLTDTVHRLRFDGNRTATIWGSDALPLSGNAVAIDWKENSDNCITVIDDSAPLEFWMRQNESTFYIVTSFSFTTPQAWSQCNVRYVPASNRLVVNTLTEYAVFNATTGETLYSGNLPHATDKAIMDTDGEYLFYSFYEMGVVDRTLVKMKLSDGTHVENNVGAYLAYYLGITTANCTMTQLLGGKLIAQMDYMGHCVLIINPTTLAVESVLNIGTADIVTGTIYQNGLFFHCVFTANYPHMSVFDADGKLWNTVYPTSTNIIGSVYGGGEIVGIVPIGAGFFAVLGTEGVANILSVFQIPTALTFLPQVNAIPTNPLLTTDSRLPATIIAAKADVEDVHTDVGTAITQATNAAADALAAHVALDNATFGLSALHEDLAAIPTVGTGDTAVNEDTGGTDNLRAVTAGGTGIDDVTVKAYLKTDYDAGNIGDAYVQGYVQTKADGRWDGTMYLDTGFTYTFVFYKQGAYLTATKEVAV